MKFLSENFTLIASGVVAAGVAAAPVITVIVDRYGSPKVKAGWSIVRRLYNRSYAKKQKK